MPVPKSPTPRARIGIAARPVNGSEPLLEVAATWLASCVAAGCSSWPRTLPLLLVVLLFVSGFVYCAAPALPLLDEPETARPAPVQLSRMPTTSIIVIANRVFKTDPFAPDRRVP